MQPGAREGMIPIQPRPAPMTSMTHRRRGKTWCVLMRLLARFRDAVRELQSGQVVAVDVVQRRGNATGQPVAAQS